MNEQFRDWASARYDGELPAADVAVLDAHLTGCAECEEYAGELALLSELTALLPREHAPATLPARVAARIRGLRTRRRFVWGLAPAFVVAAAVALIVAVLPTAGIPLFRLPDAAAAEGLLRLRTLYVEREIVEERDGGGRRTTREKVWFRVPGDVRIERRIVTSDGARSESVVVQRPGLRWDGATVYRNLHPEIALPEPLSPTVALLGEDTGPGPVVAGRPTRRYVLEVGDRRRVALVDAGVGGVLGDDERIVLEKTPQGLQGPVTITKRTLAARYDEPMADTLFDVPAGAGVDRGFRPAAVTTLALRPEALPEGFDVVLAGAGGGDESVLLARGALPILVTTAATEELSTTDERTVTVAGRRATLFLDLYAVPRVTFAVDGRLVTVAAPLPPDSLVAVAAEMFPADR